MDDHNCYRDGDIAALKTSQDAYERWQKTQNGTLLRIETKLDTKLDDIGKTVRDDLGSINNKMDDRLKEINDKFDNRLGTINIWLYGLMGSLMLSLILLVINLAIRKW